MTDRRFRLPHSRSARALLVALILIGLATPAAVSYGQALSEPGYATFADKTSAWLRDHGAGPAVTFVENWYYTRHAPSTEPANAALFNTGPGESSRRATVYAGELPTLPTPVGTHRSPRWTVAVATRSGAPVVRTSAFEPDPTHPSIVAGVAVISASTAQFHLVPGVTEPSSPLNHSDGDVPAGQLSRLAAVFNAGFRFKDITGGFYAAGREYRPLQVGQATAAIDDRGRLSIGRWGSDLTMSGHLVAARQNLDLIVYHHRPLTSTDSSANWGGAHLENQYTWRSGLGIDAHHNIIYVTGDQLNLATLASALVAAGAQNGMQLDMHRGNSTFTTWSGPRPTPTKLLAWMPGRITRYLTPDRRDFFYVNVAPTQQGQ